MNALTEIINDTVAEINNHVVETLVVNHGYNHDNAVKIVNEFEGFGPDLAEDSDF
jgi:hypothetical protein